MGCDSTKCIALIYGTCFNPRTRMGCDCKVMLNILTSVVSIHAPAWGATNPSVLNPIFGMFQSTHPHGVRHNTNYRTFINQLFQSTHPHGVRPFPPPLLLQLFRFNPRTRMGCDRIILKRKYNIDVSIHAPAWGATDISIYQNTNYRFQSTHPHGVRLSALAETISIICFNPRTRMGCDSV